MRRLGWMLLSYGLLAGLVACAPPPSSVPPPQPAPGQAYAQPAPGQAYAQPAPGQAYAQPAPGQAYAQPAPGQAYAQPAPAAASSFVVVNRSPEPICVVKFSPSTDNDWGPDRLGSNEVIRPGQRRSWQVPAGRYDFLFLDCQGRPMMERRGIDFPPSDGIVVTFNQREGGAPAVAARPAPSVTPAPSAVPAPAAGASQLVIVNQSAVPLCIVKISPTTSNEWGPDRLGRDEMIMPNTQRAWQVQPGAYDVRVEDCQGRPLLEKRNVPVTGQGVALRVH